MNRTLLAIALVAAASYAQAASYTYQGSLEDGGKPAAGLYDVQLSVTDAAQRPLAAPVTLYGVKVTKGQFSTAVDFGVDLSQYGELQLKAAVRQGGGEFIALDQPTSINLASPQGGTRLAGRSPGRSAATPACPPEPSSAPTQSLIPR